MEDRTAPQALGAGTAMWKVLASQAVMGVLVAALFWGIAGRTEAISALLGAMTCVLPNAFLALRLAVPGSDAKALLRAAWIGEIGKLGLTIAMFVLIFSLVKPLSVLPLFAGFIAAQLMMFSGLIFKDESQGRKNGG